MSIDILNNCHKAMNEHSVLYIIDMLKDKNDTKAYSFNLHMDIFLSGKEQYQSEFESIEKQTGFSITNTYNLNFSLTGRSQCVIKIKNKVSII